MTRTEIEKTEEGSPKVLDVILLAWIVACLVNCSDCFGGDVTVADVRRIARLECEK